MGMLELGLKRSVAGGNPRLVPELIASQKENATPENCAEIMEQIRHQGNVIPLPYAAVRHLLELAKIQGGTQDPEFLYSRRDLVSFATKPV